MNLPISMEPEDYGNIIARERNVDVIYNGGQVTVNRFIVRSGTRIYTIDASLDGLINNVTIEGAIELSWVDTKISERINLFKREIGKSIIYFLNGERILRKKQLNAKPFRKVSTDTQLDSSFATMDIESVTILSKITPYLICAYNGTDYITSYTDKFLAVGDQQKTLFNSFIIQLLTFFSGKNTLIVYAHNLSNFDGVLLLKHLLAYGQVEPLIHNGKLINIKLRLNIDGYKGKTIIFKDSFLLLPLSLRKLCLAFNVSISKGYFPFKFTNIFYKGLLPLIEYWKDITQAEYDSLHLQFPGGNWSFKDEAIKYCKLDCKCLFDVLIKFNELIFNEFKVNVNSSSIFTLPSLAMRIYKSQFMPENQIYQLLGKVERDIRQSYTGGSVDVYIPHNRGEGFFTKLFKTLYYYDVNSLYPFIMAKTLMPVGKPVAFLLKLGDIRLIDPKAYGFFYCKITSPDYLEHPILQRRIKTWAGGQDGVRTVAGLGTWTGWIFSGEMDRLRHAMNPKFGYQFEILKGYQFKQGLIFKNYVEKMYNLRLQYEKGTPMNLIAKLLMNSLYGKFGMKLENTIIEMFDTSNEAKFASFNEMLDVYGLSIQDFIKIDNHYVTVRKSLSNFTYSEDFDMYHGLDINIAIASAITAGARMWMSTLKNNPNFNLYYTDTDSAVTDQPLPSFLVGDNLGQFKLEHILSKAVFLAPKVYGLITENGTEIIKVKGIINEILKDIHIKDLESLLFMDSSKEFTQSKWIKKVIEGNITVNEVAYTLKVTSNKRNPVYINNIFSNTKPYNYNEINNNN